MKKSRIEWPVVLFSLPFVLLGAAACMAALWQLGNHLRALHWVPTPATVLTMATEHDGEGETSRMTARYRYETQGIAYTGTRTAFSLIRADGLDDWDERMAAILGEPGASIMIWVNPANPAESVVVRDLRWAEIGAALLFALGMGAGGLALLAKAIRPTSRPSAPPAVSLTTVLVCALLTPGFATLAWLLWRDGHPLWSGIAALPIAIAVNAAIQYAKGLSAKG